MPEGMEAAVRGDRWHRELRLIRGGYTVQPKNAWRPLLFGVRAWARVYTPFEPSSWTNAGLRVQLRPWRTVDGLRRFDATLSVPGTAAQAAVELPDVRVVPAKMRACLNGTGYKMGRWERRLAWLAHRYGLRQDPVTL